MATYHILSIDGGGIRGVLSARLLERLEESMPDLLDKVELFAGTSTGGLLALWFAAGFSPAEARALYEVKGNLVFADSILDNIRDLGNAVGAQYSLQGLQRELVAVFGKMRLRDLPKKVLISSFDLDNYPHKPGMPRTWKPKFFHNYPELDSDGDEFVVDVALRTSAAPSYFPVYQGYIDGGVVANNPSMCALAQALDPSTGGQRLVDLALFSLSTGRYLHYLVTQNADWGWVQWARPMIDLVLEGTADVADYQCSRVMGRRYHRLDPALPEPINLDDVSKIPELLALAENVDLTRTKEWLGRYFR